MDKSKDTLDRRTNDFARRSFRDTADRDYIAARLACRAELMPQFLWSAQQAFEKYFKYILLVNRIPARVGHNLLQALKLTEQLPFKIELLPESLKFIQHVASYGEYRYLDVSYFVEGYLLLDLDMAVWDIRRYCQILDVRGKKLPASEQRMIEEATVMLKTSKKQPPHEFRINGGFLEEVLAKKEHPAREALIWQNAFFSTRARKRVKIKDHLQAANSPLYLYPDMLDELLKYVYIPTELRPGYRQHLAEVLADPSKRP